VEKFFCHIVGKQAGNPTVNFAAVDGALKHILSAYPTKGENGEYKSIHKGKKSKFR
jgi:hypothetical protein